MHRTTVGAALVVLASATVAWANTPARPVPAEPPRNDWPGELALTDVTIDGCRVWVPERNRSARLSWSGACPNGIAEGRGKLVLASGEFYEGSLHGGKMDDENGVLEWWGLRYVGGFREGRLTGHAMLWWAQGWNAFAVAYRGAVVDGRAQGHGELVGARDWRGGEFRNGTLNGRGFVERPRYRYDGEFVDGRPDGVGVEVAGVYRYEGGFSRGRFSGRGVLEREGVRHDGEFRDGTPSGPGVQRLPDGTLYDGAFSQGDRDGRGVLTMPDGGRYEGDFRRGAAEGAGVYTAADGTRYDGAWKNGCFSDGARRAAVVTPPDFCP
jgi:hypothetical protein